jgi:hypothetical protein
MEVEKINKLKDRYFKLILFKVWVPFCKSDERSIIISKVLKKKNTRKNDGGATSRGNQISKLGGNFQWFYHRFR